VDGEDSEIHRRRRRIEGRNRREGRHDNGIAQINRAGQRRRPKEDCNQTQICKPEGERNFFFGEIN